MRNDGCKECCMQIRVGYEMSYICPQTTPMILTVSIHYSRASDVITPDYLVSEPTVPISGYRDGFGNWCTRIVAPEGRIRIRGNGVVRDTGQPEVAFPSAFQHPVEDLPEETLVFMLGSRYCETDRLSDIAWSHFGHTGPGWARVQAICDFVHNHIAVGYQAARPAWPAREPDNARIGVCRDSAHLAVASGRKMKMPVGYCTDYL